MKTEYEFNDCGVCTNPKIVFTRNLGKWEVQVKIAQSPNGKWDFGYIVNYNTGGVCCPVMLQKDDKGLSEDEARGQALECIERFVSSMQGTNEKDRLWLLDIIREELSPKLF